MSKAEAYRHYTKANELRVRKREQEALEEYQKALALYPGLDQAKKEIDELLSSQEKKHLQFADIYQQEGKLDKAIEELEQLLVLYPNSWKARKNLAQIYLTKDELLKASVELKKAIDIAPHLCGLHFTMAKLHDMMENFDMALEEYNKALSQNPTDALILKQKKLTEELRQLYSDKSKAENTERLIEISNIYIEKGVPEKAVAILQKAAQSPASQQEAMYALANTYYKLKHFENAIQCYQASAQIKPVVIKLDELYYNLGLSYSALSQYDNAISAMHACITENPNGKAASKADEAIPFLQSQKGHS